MVHRRALLAPVVLMLGGATLSACGQASPPAAAPDSGIVGRTMVDGGCPVLRPDSPCPDIPVAAKVTVARVDTGEQVAAVATGTDGRFRVRLAPGTYLLHPANTTNAVVPQAPVVRVTVRSTRYEDVTIRFDSGVRGPAAG